LGRGPGWPGLCPDCEVGHMSGHRLALAAALVLGVAAGVGAEEKAAEKKPPHKLKVVVDPKHLRGIWEVLRGDLPGARVEFGERGTLTIVEEKDGQEIRAKGTYKVEGDKIRTTL